MCDQDGVDAATAELQQTAQYVGPQGQLGHRNDSIPLQGLTSCGSASESS